METDPQSGFMEEKGRVIALGADVDFNDPGLIEGRISFIDSYPSDLDLDCQPGRDDFRYRERRERFGNNKKKVSRAVKRVRAAIAKQSRRRNRRKK